MNIFHCQASIDFKKSKSSLKLEFVKTDLNILESAYGVYEKFKSLGAVPHPITACKKVSSWIYMVVDQRPRFVADPTHPSVTYCCREDACAPGNSVTSLCRGMAVQACYKPTIFDLQTYVNTIKNNLAVLCCIGWELLIWVRVF